jgi:DNA mismatch endonuclease (patch repair protein)
MPFENVPDVVRRRMSRIRKRDSRPELIVRRIVTQLGFRYRLHRNDLPGSPDLVFGGRRKVIFVHGCFWHQHDCALGKSPRSRPEYWLPKLARNRARDAKMEAALRAAHWDVITVWECETRDEQSLGARLKVFLREDSASRAYRAVVAQPARS